MKPRGSILERQDPNWRIEEVTCELEREARQGVMQDSIREGLATKPTAFGNVSCSEKKANKFPERNQEGGVEHLK